MKLDNIKLDHGGGGMAANYLIEKIFLKTFNNSILNKLDDSAIINLNEDRIAFSTDSYVVDPIFFPGGSIGDLAVNGTVNDISMCGAIPKFLSLGVIIEEGFSIQNLKKIVNDINQAAKEANIKIVTGDTKVVHKGSVDKIFINTSGIGKIPQGINISGNLAQPGDLIILSGTIGDHGMTIMTQRDGFKINSKIKSDTASLNHMIKKIIETKKTIHTLRDPTRGGIATILNEIARKSEVGILIFEKEIPIKSEVKTICDTLGFDPLYVANEGKLLAFIPKKHAFEILSIIKNDKNGKDAKIIGEVVKNHPRKVYMTTKIGGQRPINMLIGEQLPRIC